MSEPEMVERVARALCAEWCVDPDGTEGQLIEQAPLVPDKGEANWNAFEPLARAAITAMREPTEAMVEAGQGHCGDYSNPRWAWEEMIDAALTPPRSGSS